MTNIKVVHIPLLITLIIFSRGEVSSQKRPALNPEQQKALLAKRLPSGAITGTFSSFGSLLFAALDIAIHTNDKEIGRSELNSPFPDFYKPTIKELLDTIALQTRSSWSYDAQTDYWTFAKPAVAKPFKITLANEWSAEDRGYYVRYKPAAFPVGLDIYYYGSFSSDDASQQSTVWKRVRDSWATGFATRLKRDATVSEMKPVTLDGVEALYFQTSTPRPGGVWKQWALVKNGHAFVIASGLPLDEKKLLSEVETMVNSFRVAQ